MWVCENEFSQMCSDERDLNPHHSENFKSRDGLMMFNALK